MSNAVLADVAADPRETTTTGLSTVEDPEEIQDILAALNDSDCRAILEATNDRALSATELSETCGLPLSTAYRKVDLLTEAGMLREGTRIRRSGSHASEYSRSVEDVVVTVDADDGLSLQISGSTKLSTNLVPWAVRGN